MLDIETDRWRRLGSSIVWNSAALAPLLSAGCLISLREVLSWRKVWPSAPPCGSDTVLVGGLEACMELLVPPEAEQFLRRQIKPLILDFQRRWDQRGLVFGFGAPENAFKVEPASEEILFIRRDQSQVRLSFAMWDGSASLNLNRLVQPAGGAKGKVTIGYHVQRIS